MLLSHFVIQFTITCKKSSEVAGIKITLSMINSLIAESLFVCSCVDCIYRQIICTVHMQACVHLCMCPLMHVSVHAWLFCVQYMGKKLGKDQNEWEEWPPLLKKFYDSMKGKEQHKEKGLKYPPVKINGPSSNCCQICI